MLVVEHLIRVGVLKASKWKVLWADLTEADMSDKISNAKGMSEINRAAAQSDGQLIYHPEEIRQVTGHEGTGPDEFTGESEEE